MSLKRIQVVDYDADYMGCPPIVEMLINTDEIVTVREFRTHNRPEVRSLLRLRSGKTWECVQEVYQFEDEQ